MVFSISLLSQDTINPHQPQKTMTYLLEKLTLSTTAIALTFSVLPMTSVQAAEITYSFSGVIDSGSLINESYTGSFSFDDANLMGSGEEALAVSEVTFNFLGSTFTQLDAALTPTIDFSDGQFLGLSYTVINSNLSFSFIPGLFDSDGAYFAYESNSGNAGFGSLSYGVVPEPLTILGSLAAMGFGMFFKRKLS